MFTVDVLGVVVRKQAGPHSALPRRLTTAAASSSNAKLDFLDERPNTVLEVEYFEVRDLPDGTAENADPSPPVVGPRYGTPGGL